MAATKNLRTIIAAATSNAAGATTTGTVVNLTTAYGALLTTKISNSAGAPTLAASAYIYTSGDNFATAGKLLATALANTNNGAVNEFVFEIPAAVMYLRVDVKDNTGVAVTCEAFAQELTTI